MTEGTTGRDPRRQVSRRDAAQLRAMVDSGMTPKEAALEFPQYDADVAYDAANRNPPDNETRDKAFYAICRGEAFPEIADRLGMTPMEVSWVDAFYMPTMVRAEVARLDAKGVPLPKIYEQLREAGCAASMTGLRFALRILRRKQLKSKAGRGWGPGYKPNRAQRLAANPETTFRPPDKTLDRPPKFEDYETFVWRKNQERAAKFAQTRAAATAPAKPTP